MEAKDSKTQPRSTKETPQDELKQAVLVAVVAALAGKGIPPTEAAGIAKEYAIAAVEAYF